MISPQMNGKIHYISYIIGNVLVCAHLSSKLAHGTYCWLAVNGKPVLFWKGISGLKFPCFFGLPFTASQYCFGKVLPV